MDYAHEYTREQLSVVTRSRALPESIDIIYQQRPARDLTGEDSIEVRTFGPNFVSPLVFNGTWKNTREGRKEQTELAELHQWIDEHNKVGLEFAMDAGDLWYQYQVMELHHKDHGDYDVIKPRFDEVIAFADEQLHMRGLSFAAAKLLAGRKYGLRAGMHLVGLSPQKDKVLEHERCAALYRDILEKRHEVLKKHIDLKVLDEALVGL